MLDIKEACRILGISESAGKNEIEKRYFILLKKHKTAVEQGEEGDMGQEEFKRATEAYNLLMGYEEPSTEAPFVPNPVLKKMGIDEKKARNFFYYYKFHILIGIALAVVLFFTVRGFVTRVEPDFTTAFIGEIDYTQSDALVKQIKEAVPEIKVPGIDGSYVTASGQNQNDYTMLMKAVALLASGSVDLLILDKAEYDRFTKDSGFVSLDDIAKQLSVDTAKNTDLVLKAKDTQTQHLYGIDVSSSPALAKAGIRGTRMIAAIPVNTKKQATAIKLIEYLLKQ